MVNVAGRSQDRVLVVEQNHESSPLSTLVRACNVRSLKTHDRFQLIRVYQAAMKNDELLKRQKKLNRVEEMLDAFRRKLVVLGRVEAGDEVRYRLAKHLLVQLFSYG